MTSANNGNGKLPTLPVLLVLMTAVTGALTTWALKLEDRIYDLSRNVPTRAEFSELRSKMASRFDRIEDQLQRLIAQGVRPPPDGRDQTP